MATAKKIVMAAAGAGGSDKFILLDTITGNTSFNAWTTYSYDSTDGLVAGSTGRMLIHHVAPTTYTSDQQVDNFFWNGVSTTFSSNNGGFEYAVRDGFLSALSSDAARITAYDSLTFSNVLTGSSTSGAWLRDRGGTPSTGTGSTQGTGGSTSDWYLYFESSGTSGSWPNGAILRSPEITLGTPGYSAELVFRSSRYGASMGNTEVWWKEN